MSTSNLLQLRKYLFCDRSYILYTAGNMNTSIIRKKYRGEDKIYWLIVNPFQGSNTIKVFELEMYNLAFNRRYTNR